MFAKRLFIILSVLIASALLTSVCYAEDDAALSQAYAWEQNMDVFIAGSMSPDTLSCKVSNQTAEVAGCGLLADKGITVRTTILLDVSASMPSKARGNVKSYINSLIEKIGKNEQYKIVTFGEQLSVLQDFSADRYGLVNAADKIEFKDQQSKIYDAIYNTIPKVQPIDGSPCYYRTIVITDGVDDTASGVTKEELYLKLQNETYPIDVVAVSSGEQAESNKELSALTRMSGGRYSNLNGETDVATLSSSLAVDGVFWLRATIPGALLDGSTRQVNISDGISSIQFDVKVPVFDVPVVETPTPTEEAPTETILLAPSAAPEAAPAAPAQTTIPVAPQSPLAIGSGNYAIVLYIGAGMGLVIVLAIIAAVIVVGKKKKKVSRNGGVSAGGNSSFSDKTELLTNPPSNGKDGNPCIRLRNVNAADQVWDISLGKDVLIGRDTNCQVCIAESSVARQQCRIYMNGVAAVENLSHSNITQLNGKQLNAPAEINVGDKLKCGRITLIVDSLYTSDSHNVGELNKGTVFINI